MTTIPEQQRRADEITAALRKSDLQPSERRAMANELADLLLADGPAHSAAAGAAGLPPAAAAAAGTGPEVTAQLAAFADRVDGLRNRYRWGLGDQRVLAGLHGDALRLLPDGTYVPPLRVHEAGERPFAMLPAAVSRTLSDPHASAETRMAALADLETAMGAGGGADGGSQAQ